MKDWMIRAIKTFVQAFFGVLIPEVCAMLQNGWPESWDKVWIILAPTIAAALSAAICAVWNIIIEGMNTGVGKHTEGHSVQVQAPDKPEKEEKAEDLLGEFWD